MTKTKFRTVNAGSYRRRASYQTATTSLTSLGAKVSTWTTRQSLWVQVRSPSGRESLNNQVMTAMVSHYVEHRYCGFVPSPLGRYVLDDGRVFDIVSSTDPDDRRVIITSACNEQVAPAIGAGG